MIDAAIGFAVWLGCAGVSAWALRAAGFRFMGRVEEFATSSALGLGAGATAILGIGSFGLSRPVFAVSAAVLAVVGIPALALRLRRPGGPGLDRLDGFERTVAVFVAIAAGLSLAAALAPATGQDELCYHLMQPKNYVRDGRIHEVPYATSALWPYLMEMWFTLGVLLRGAELGKFFHWAAYATTGFSIYGYVRRYASLRAAFFSAAVFWLTPAAFLQASFAYVDDALALFAFAAFAAWCAYDESGDKRWAVLAGLFAGFAASTKLLGLFVCLLLAAAFVWSAFRRGAKALAAGGWAALAAVLAGGVWYVRSWRLRGNPVFPFYPEFFGGNGWHDPTYVDAHGRPGLFGFPLALWDLTMRPDWFGGEHIGPMYLILVTLALFLGAPSYARRALAFAAGYFALWYAVDPNVRFAFPALALAAAACGPVIDELVSNGWARRVFTAAFGAVFAIEAAFAWYHFWDEAALLATGKKQEYLLKNERSYGAAAAIDAVLAQGDKILSTGEARGYYFNHPFTLEGDFSQFTGYGVRLEPAAVADFLAEREFTHVLSSSLEPERVEGASRVSNLLRAGDARFTKELQVRSSGVDYVLYRIEASGSGRKAK